MCHLWRANVYYLDHNIMQSSEDLIELNFEGPQMQKWNIPTYRAQRVDEKSGVIYQVIIVIKISKMIHFLYFQMMIAKK